MTDYGSIILVLLNTGRLFFPAIMSLSCNRKKDFLGGGGGGEIDSLGGGEASPPALKP